MGLFGKHHKKKILTTQVEETATLSETERGALETKIKELNAELESTSEKVPILNGLGAIYRSLGNLDSAIEWFEKSLDEKEAYGPAYNALTEIYNIKLRDAASQKDGNGIEQWTSKLDDHLARSKRIIRSNY